MGKQCTEHVKVYMDRSPANIKSEKPKTSNCLDSMISDNFTWRTKPVVLGGARLFPKSVRTGDKVLPQWCQGFLSQRVPRAPKHCCRIPGKISWCGLDDPCSGGIPKCP